MKKYSLIVLFSLFFIGCLNQIYVENVTEYNKSVFGNVIIPLPDAIPIFDDGRKYILTDPTTKYKHGVLGDGIEAESLSIVEGDILRKIDFYPQVFEGLFPLLADFDLDGEKEIIATLSGNGAGAQLVVYDKEGKRIASSNSLSSGWRHALTVAPFSPNGDLELADISKPHVNKEVEFFQLQGDRLVKVAGIKGYSTHTIGSRNLGLFAVIEDSERYLLIVPTADFKTIAAIGRTSNGAEEVWRKKINEMIYSISVENNEVIVNEKPLKK
jgi:hypothetical protein